MAKIRTIKVEFWTSEQVVSCSIHARLLFIGMWNFCDDGGNHPASCSRLKMEVFPADAFSFVDIQNWVDELIKVGLLVEYEVESKAYWHVTGWSHQTIARKFIKFPSLLDPKALLKHCLNTARAVPQHCPSIAVNGNGNGNGNGKDIMSSCGDTFKTTANTGETQLDPPSLCSNSKQHKECAKRLIEFLNEKANRKFRVSDTNLKFIMNRLKSGATEVQCRQIILRKCAEWGNDEKMAHYLRPETLFHATKFESYLGQLVLPKPKYPNEDIFEGAII